MLIQGMPAWNNDEDGRLIGGQLSDDLHGADGNDLLKGNKGHDYLYGNQGSDTLKGGKGNDILTGGSGSDFLHGGSGQNVFGDEQDGKTDTLKVKQDKTPDRIMNLDQKDIIQIKSPGAKSDDNVVALTSRNLENVSESILISLDGIGVAYYTGDNLSTIDLESMIKVIWVDVASLAIHQ